MSITPLVCILLTGDDKRLDEWISEGRIVKVHEPADSPSRELASEEPNRKMTRGMKRKMQTSSPMPASDAEIDPKYAQLEKEHEEATKKKNIHTIYIGEYEIDAWYYSPYPDEYCKQETLYICGFCLKYMKYSETLLDHRNKCDFDSPPGRLIYKNEGLGVFEVDGEQNKLYCQNLCLLSKLFLDHKMVYYDISPFNFYVLAEEKDGQFHIAGYFSKEKNCLLDYNLSCIMILPPHQRKGYGKFLIDLSYELSKREGVPGTPEKPLSDLGLRTYRDHWASEILRLLKAHDISLSASDLVRLTGFRTEDVTSTLDMLNLVQYWRGEYVIQTTMKQLDELIRQYPLKKKLLDPAKVDWLPPVPKKTQVERKKSKGSSKNQ